MNYFLSVWLIKRITFTHRWARGGGKGGEYPPRTSKKVLPPQTNNLFTTVPPSNWLATEGGRKNDYFCSKLPKFCRLSAAIKKIFRFCLLFPPLSPPPCPPMLWTRPGGRHRRSPSMSSLWRIIKTIFTVFHTIHFLTLGKVVLELLKVGRW